MKGTIFGSLIGVFVLCGFVGAVTLIVATVSQLKKEKSPVMIKVFTLAMIFVIFAAASWILNMGWFRVILTMCSVPLIHSAAFLYITTVSAKYIKQTKQLKIYTVLSFVTYILSYLFFADFGDIGPMYVFFGLIRGDIASDLTWISILSFILNIVFIVLMIAYVKRLKKKIVVETP